MSTTHLLHPNECAVRPIVGMAPCAFRTGPQIHPRRAAYDFYPTPPEATQALLSAEAFDGSVWEPACGEGHIAKVLESSGLSVIATDLIDYGYGQGGRDFLAERKPLAKHIITNPPYGKGLADAFAKHALKLAAESGGTVAMLMNIAGLCHPLRHSFWTERPPSVVYCLDECVCWPYGKPTRSSASIAQQRYCWVVWKPGTSGTELRWLTTRSPPAFEGVYST